MILKAEKDALRAHMREVRDAIPDPDRAERGLAVAQRVLDAVEGRRLVFIFLSFGSEVPTDPICERLAAAGHALAVPHIDGGELTPVEYEAQEATASAVWGIREPAVLRPIDPLVIDAVVVPGLAFGRDGFRVGYGGGFYDRFLRRCRPDVLRAGICFQEQVVREVPHDPNDEPLHLILNDTETIACP